jgi:predicted DNA-binding transcriptional regulator AlpA
MESLAPEIIATNGQAGAQLVDAALPQDGANGLPLLVLRAPEAAALCKVAVRTWRAWDAAGRIPQPVRIGRLTLWRVDELREWIAAGCPRRQEWENRCS